MTTLPLQQGEHHNDSDGILVNVTLTHLLASSATEGQPQLETAMCLLILE